MNHFCESAKTAKLIFQMIFMRGYPYRVEVEKYYLNSGDASMLSLYFFPTFAKAQKFIKDFSGAYYCIKLYRQRGVHDFLCNIEDGRIATSTDLRKQIYQKDKYGYTDILCKESNGWYLRGENTHSPAFLSTFTDLYDLLAETMKRCSYEIGDRTLRKIIQGIFKERYVEFSPQYVDEFKNIFQIKIQYEMAKEKEKK